MGLGDRQGRYTGGFDNQGRLPQVDNAHKAAERGTPSVGVVTDEGTVLAAVNADRGPLVVDETIEKLHTIHYDKILAATSGHQADAHRVVDFARDAAEYEREEFDEVPDIRTLSKNYIEPWMHMPTQRGMQRPLGCSVMFAGIDDEDGPVLYEHDPSGVFQGYRAHAIGDGSSTIQKDLNAGYEDGIDLGEGAALAHEAVADYSEDAYVEMQAVTPDGCMDDDAVTALLD